MAANPIDDIGGAAQDIFAAAGASESASAYSEASNLAQSNADITARSTAIQTQQEGIQTYKVLGTETADVASAGFTQGGSAGDLMRASAQQAALSKQLTQDQGEITEQGYEEQAVAYKGQEKASNTQAEGDVVGGVLKTAAAVIGWVICTELVAQRRMPRRFWMPGSAVFAQYPDYVREGYWVWATPSVRHLRAHPNSTYSRCLETVFNWRAENIAAHAGVKGARKLIRGAAVTAVLWPLCYGIGAVRALLNKTTDWKGLYRA